MADIHLDRWFSCWTSNTLEITLKTHFNTSIINNDILPIIACHNRNVGTAPRLKKLLVISHKSSPIFTLLVTGESSSITFEHSPGVKQNLKNGRKAFGKETY